MSLSLLGRWGARAHNSWFVGECIATLCHAVKLWPRTYAETWDAPSQDGVEMG